MATEHRQPNVLEWSLPVVYDCLRDHYRDLLPASNGARDAMTERHFALWTGLLQGDFSHHDADRHLLVAQARELDVGPDVWGAADRHVAAEILDMLLRRFRRMPEEARRNNAALLEALKHLQRSSDDWVEDAHRLAA